MLSQILQSLRARSRNPLMNHTVNITTLIKICAQMPVSFQVFSYYCELKSRGQTAEFSKFFLMKTNGVGRQ